MEIAIAIATGVALLVFGLVGYRRDLRRGVMALAGTLLGVLLVNFWAATWGQSIAAWLGSDSAGVITSIVSIITLVLTTLLVGYGGGTLLPAVKEKPSFWSRVAGALLGVFNGALLVAYVLQYATANNPAARAQISSSITGRLLIEGLPWLFLGTAGLISVLVIGRFIVSKLTRKPPEPEQPAQLSATPEADRQVVEKIDQRMQQH